MDGSRGIGEWDQFAEHEKRFGGVTDYCEDIYTTSLNKSHPNYKSRVAAAERLAREIERSAPTTAHVAEERVMDHSGGDGRDEEEKYAIESSLTAIAIETDTSIDTVACSARISLLFRTGRTSIRLRPGAPRQARPLSKAPLLILLSSRLS